MNVAERSARNTRPVFLDLSRGLLWGSVASALAALPGAWRAAQAGAPLAGCWIALAGSTALLLAPAVGAFRVARPMPRAVPTVLVGLLLAAGPLMIFARLLKATTHYRPLGGATFAVVAAGVLLGCIAVSGRLVSATEQAGSAQRRRLAKRLLWVLAVASSLIGLVLAAPALGARSAATGLRAGVFDGTLTVALGLLATLPGAAGRPAAARTRWVGPLLWLTLVVAALLVLYFAPAVHAACSAHAPVLLGPAGWLD